MAKASDFARRKRDAEAKLKALGESYAALNKAKAEHHKAKHELSLMALRLATTDTELARVFSDGSNSW